MMFEDLYAICKLRPLSGKIKKVFPYAGLKEMMKYIGKMPPSLAD